MAVSDLSSKASSLSTVTLEDSQSFLKGVFISDVDGSSPAAVEAAPVDNARQVIRTRRPQIEVQNDGVCLGLPIFFADELRCVVQLCGNVTGKASGVFEVWEPQGAYQDLKLTAGYFGHLDRFQNVSTYVRFEPGSGLPGQAAQAGHSVVHDNLRNHPGFLRAAGASAGELKTALALPIFAPDFLCSVLLISSIPSPMAKRIEVWRMVDDRPRIEHVATSVPDSLDPSKDVSATEELAHSLISDVRTRRSAILRTDLGQPVGPSADDQLVANSCLAIPTCQGQQLTSVALLWL